MKTLNKIFLLSIFLIGSNGFAQSQDSFILNYEDVDIKKVTQDIAQFSKRTIILDPRVKGKISIYSNANLNRQQVWNVYLRTIQVNGFSAIIENGFARVVPENEATRDKSVSSMSSGDFQTVVIPLTNRSTDEILPMLKPITGRQSHLSSIPSINSILLVDRSSNVNRVINLIKDLDKNNSAKISIIKLDNLSSIEAVRILDKLKAQNNPTINKFIAIPFSPSNSVIVSANEFVTSNIKETLKRALDKSINIPVFPVGVPQTKDKNTVRSVQRIANPTKKTAHWVAQSYPLWLSKIFSRIISAEKNNALLKFKFLGICLLQLEYIESRSDNNRQLFYITGGFLTKRTNRGWLEFRSILDGEYIITAIHEFVPRLPWFVYKFTQAKAHLLVMKKFEKHLSTLKK